MNLTEHKKFLYEARVLKLNSQWRPIGVIQPVEAMQNMAGKEVFNSETKRWESRPPSMKGLDIGTMSTVSWEEWVALEPLDELYYIATGSRRIRIPTVVIAYRYGKMPQKGTPLKGKTIRERDGNRCQYTGKVLEPDEGNVDHVVPRSRGGKTTWDNCVWASRDINSRKGNRLNEEVGLKLVHAPVVPKSSPICESIKRQYAGQNPHWDIFLK